MYIFLILGYIYLSIYLSTYPPIYLSTYLSVCLSVCVCVCVIWLVVWNIFIFPYIGNVIIPIDFHIFKRGGPTTNQLSYRFQSHRAFTDPRSSASPTWNPSCPWPSASTSSGSVARWKNPTETPLFFGCQSAGNLRKNGDLTIKHGDLIGFHHQKWCDSMGFSSKQL